ncbi:hypothetical protein [Kribbella sp. DT2]|uniref:hypothetical protein n=1 Tax=Kribbella sp. DT2 TaxID=3393427 RepID=UPI003CFA1C24
MDGHKDSWKREDPDEKEKETEEREGEEEGEGEGEGEGRRESGGEGEPWGLRHGLTKKALKLLRFMETVECQSDPHLFLVAEERWRQLPEYVRQDARSEFRDHHEDQMKEPARRGRRMDLDAEYRRRHPDPDDPGRYPFYVKVTVSGSGDGEWRTEKVNISSTMGLGWKDGVESKTVVYYERETLQGKELSIAGVGGAGTKNRKKTVHGIMDRESNSIAAVKAQIEELIVEAFRAVADEWFAKGEKGRPIVVLFRGHSRGAVAAGQVANAIKTKYPYVRVELAQLDPVPGPGHRGEDVDINVGPRGMLARGLDESTVVYSIAPGYLAGFEPQRVHGAKRIIISRQDHGVGIEQGFIYNDIRYRGSALNSLEPGVYIDSEKDGNPENAHIERVARLEDVAAAIALVHKGRRARGLTLEGREDPVREVLEEFYNKRMPRR